MREYIVSLHEGVDYSQFWTEIENDGTPSIYIPDRSVDIVNARPGSQRSCHYGLSDAEAEQLKQDPRVYSVEIPPQQRTDIEIKHTAVQISNFSKDSFLNTNAVNWGLLRCNQTTNVFGSNITAILSSYYGYNLDGTGVDVVIQDSGLQVDHSEFQDQFGSSRVQQINWYTASGLPGTQSANHYRDFDGHGTHVAGIATGKTYGWAKNAQVYSIKVSGLEGTGDSGTGISVTDCFDVIKLWHRNKTPDPRTGLKRPTIVNMSWSYIRTLSGLTGGNYRDTLWSGTGPITGYGMIFQANTHGVRIGSVDTDVDELLAEGVIVCHSAGNYSQKIDLSDGIDYNNYYTDSSGTVYYHRGGSPMGTATSGNAAIVVGNLSNNLLTGLERKNLTSEMGPRVDVWAPGTNIMSTTSNTNAYGAAVTTYPSNSNYKITILSGTSQASPQVAGICALLAQVYPHATPAQMNQLIKDISIKNLIYSTGSTTDYATTQSLLGAPNNFLYNRFAGNISFSSNGSFSITGIGVGV